MKKITLCLLTLCLLLSVNLMPLRAVTALPSHTQNTTLPVQPPEVSVLLNRLNEIKALDKSKMSFGEKRKLRKETRSIKHELRVNQGGIYLSVGAIIIIILLLILLL